MVYGIFTVLISLFGQENKQLLKEKLGFKGYKIGEFGPKQTRRATAANWLLSYMQIHGIEF